MPEERDFDYVVGKLPRRDKDGNDTTGDRIGKGGVVIVTMAPIPLLLMIWKWLTKILPRKHPNQQWLFNMRLLKLKSTRPDMRICRGMVS